MSAMTLAQVIMACSLSASPHVNDTLHRVILASSGGQPYWIATPKGHVYTPEQATRAEAIVEGLPHQELHLGLAALSSVRLRRLDVSISQAFEVCSSVGVASLELESVLTIKTHKSVQAMHEALALYYSPDEPQGLGALSFGAKVLAIAHLDVEKEATSEAPLAGPTYTLSLGLFGAQDTSSHHEDVFSGVQGTTGIFGEAGKVNDDREEVGDPDSDTVVPETQPSTRVSHVEAP